MYTCRESPRKGGEEETTKKLLVARRREKAEREREREGGEMCKQRERANGGGRLSPERSTVRIMPATWVLIVGPYHFPSQWNTWHDLLVESTFDDLRMLL